MPWSRNSGQKKCFLLKTMKKTKKVKEVKEIESEERKGKGGKGNSTFVLPDLCFGHEVQG